MYRRLCQAGSGINILVHIEFQNWGSDDVSFSCCCDTGLHLQDGVLTEFAAVGKARTVCCLCIRTHGCSSIMPHLALLQFEFVTICVASRLVLQPVLATAYAFRSAS